MTKAPIYLVDVIGQVVQAADAILYPTLKKHILYSYGYSIQILAKLEKVNQSITNQNGKYPLFALYQPFVETFNDKGFYCQVSFPKIVIGALKNQSDTPDMSYEKNFKPVLYPVWQEFLRQLARHPNVLLMDPGTFSYKKIDCPSAEPAADKELKSSFSDYMDFIQIQDLTFNVGQISSACTKKLNS